eukprot:m.15788 g.15788  ORF g.15788 m.15788 type:complete len:260 (-) comp7928_c0_seq1:41-820(-)
MSTAEEHYTRLLSTFYTWSLIGDDFPQAVETEISRLKEISHVQQLCCQHQGGSALDLGSGSGLHSLALAKLGFQVRAVDMCLPLLDEMKVHAAAMNLHVEAVQGNILDDTTWGKPANGHTVISCMGDTLSHLSSLQEMQAFFAGLPSVLAKNGLVIISFRDQQVELTGPDRFILVRSSPDRIHTCCLGFRDEYIDVEDLFYELQPATSTWRQHVGGFVKLRLKAEQVAQALQDAGFRLVNQTTHAGMLYVVATMAEQKE